MKDNQILNGFILLYKPAGISSMKAITKLKYALKEQYKIDKIGHTGTLDPFAEGLLPICIGQATKFASLFLEAKKKYIFSLKFGTSTDTGDNTGKIIYNQNNIQQATYIPTKTEIEQLLPTFIGKQMQKPHIFSAVHIDGKRAYELARKNHDHEEIKKSIQAKEIEIFSLSFISFADNIFQGEVECSSGTYVRVLAEEIAKKLNSCGHLVRLIRTSVGNISLDQTTKADNILPEILPINNIIKFLEGFMPIIKLNDEQASNILKGQYVFDYSNDNSLHTNQDCVYLAIKECSSNKKTLEKTLEKTLDQSKEQSFAQCIIGLVKKERNTIKPYKNLSI